MSNRRLGFLVLISKNRHDGFGKWLEFEVETIFHRGKQLYIESVQKIVQQAKLTFPLAFFTTFCHVRSC